MGKDLSDYQYGFGKGRSTVYIVNKVISITKDATAGFQWKGSTVEYCRIVTLECLSNRILCYDSTDSREIFILKGEVPQGLFFGSLL